MLLANDIERVLFSEDDIDKICKRLGKQITEDYKDKNLLLVSVLKGAVPFMTDLMREIDCKCRIDFIQASSYGFATKTSGVVTMKKDLDFDVSGYDILFVEDILDSGYTLKTVKELFAHRNAASVKICVFMDKPSGRKADITADYIGVTVEDTFVVGYGLDYEEKYRNLPYVGVLKSEIYENK